jgi:hypothetical protein
MERGFRTPVSQVGRAQIRQRRCVVRIDTEGGLDQSSRSVKLALLKRHNAKQMSGVEILRQFGQNFTVESGSLIEFTFPMEGDRSRHQGMALVDKWGRRGLRFGH